MIAPASTSYRNPNSELAKAKEIANENWGSPWMIILLAVVLAIMLALVHYYQFASLFAAGGSLAGTGWVASGDGILFHFIVGIAMAASVSAFALSIKRNGDAMSMVFGLSLVLGLILLYYMFQSAKDGFKNQFILWASISVVALVGLAGWGTYSLWAEKSNITKNPSAYDSQAKEAIPQRFTYSAVMTGITALAGIAIIVAALKIYAAL